MGSKREYDLISPALRDSFPGGEAKGATCSSSVAFGDSFPSERGSQEGDVLIEA